MKPANYAPVYAGLYPELAEIARRRGYAMAVHGSLARDADLICIPWIEDADDPQSVVEAITAEFAIHRIEAPVIREHGRIVYTLVVAGPGCFIDLSFTPRAALASREAKPAPDAVAEAAIADDDSLAKRLSELGWQIHNLGCEYQNDEKLLDRLQDLRGMAWEIADTVREGAA